MERNSWNALKVGTLVLACILLLFLAVFSITDRRLGKLGYEFTVVFPSAQGLNKGATVQYAGVAVGEVKDVRFAQAQGRNIPEVELTVWLPQDVNIHEDVVARINTFGLLGEKYLELTPMHGEGEVITPKYRLRGIETASMETILQQSSQALVRFNKILDQLTSGRGTVGKLIYSEELHQSLVGLVGSMQELVEQIKRQPWTLFRKPKR